MTLGSRFYIRRQLGMSQRSRYLANSGSTEDGRAIRQIQVLPRMGSAYPTSDRTVSPLLYLFERCYKLGVRRLLVPNNTN
jgi:hypothetical protein